MQVSAEVSAAAELRLSASSASCWASAHRLQLLSAWLAETERLGRQASGDRAQPAGPATPRSKAPPANGARPQPSGSSHLRQPALVRKAATVSPVFLIHIYDIIIVIIVVFII